MTITMSPNSQLLTKANKMLYIDHCPQLIEEICADMSMIQMQINLMFPFVIVTQNEVKLTRLICLYIMRMQKHQCNTGYTIT